MLLKKTVLPLVFAVFLLASFAAAQEREYKEFYYQCYFLTGTTVGECNANCMAACMPACTGAAAAAGVESSACPGGTSSKCAEACPGYFSNVPTVDDGLPQVPAMPPQNYWTATPAEAGVWDPGEPTFPSFPTPDGTYVDCLGCIWVEEPPVCPDFAPDGHIMRWDDLMGCYDVYWKEDYCGQAQSCNQDLPCTGKQGCIWNGAACIPCNAPSCNYFCPRAGGAGNAGANAGNNAEPQQVTVQQKEIPKPTAVPVVENPSIHPTIQPTGQPTAIPIPTPAVEREVPCNLFPNCSTCANAPQKNGESQCGWSGFFDACINGETWGSLNESGFKAGWIDEEKYCGNEPKVYCFQFTDCFSCAGVGGVQRRCQWSVKENACKPYDPLSDFKTEANAQADNVIVPQMCKGDGCSEYESCGKCEQNAACLWSKASSDCVAFKGDGNTDRYYFYPSNCPAEASPSSAPQPLACPTGCECSPNSRVTSCGGSQVKEAGFVRTDRATANAAAAASIEQLDDVSFNQAASQFVVKGHNDGRLFFVIPVSVDVSASVNAQTGVVEKIERSWWSFLVG